MKMLIHLIYGIKESGGFIQLTGEVGTGKTTLSADPNRQLIGDDEHCWSDDGVFNIEGGCYAKCIKLSKEGEPQIWDAIRFGAVLENVVLDEETRVPDYDAPDKTENTRVAYPVEYIPDAKIPSVCGHPKNVIFLTADAFGVLPPVSKLTSEQAMYYFINGYTSKLAGTEAGVTEPQPNFSPCFGGPFLPRPPMDYARQLARRVEEHGVEIKNWNEEQLQAFESAWLEVAAELAAEDAFFKEVWDDLQGFRSDYKLWSNNIYLPRPYNSVANQ